MYLFWALLIASSNANSLSNVSSFDYLTQCLEFITGESPENPIIYTTDLNLQLEKPLIRLNLIKGDFVWFKVERAHIFIIRLENGNFGEILEKLYWKNPNFNPRGYFIVITEQLNSSIFMTASKFYIHRLLVIQAGPNYDIYSYNPYLNRNVNEPKIDFFRWGSCFNTSEHHYSTLGYLPKKWSNTTIRVLNNVVPPYSICTICEKNRGIEIETFDIIARKLEFKVNYTRDGFAYWGSKMNGTYSHILGDLQKRQGDMTIGVFHSKFEEHLDFDMSFNYMEDGTYWLVPRASILPYWKRISLIFTIEVYMAVVFCIMVMMVACRLLYYQTYGSSFLMVFQILLEVGLSQMPPFRTITIFWICSCLVLSTMFKSKLTETMTTTSYEHQIETLGDIVASNLHITIDHDIAKFYDYHTNHDEEFLRNNYEFCPDPRVCINRTAFVQDCVTIDFQRSHEFFLPQLVDSKQDVLLYLFKTAIFPVHIHLFFVKGYPIFPQIDELLIRVRSVGIIQHLYDKAGYNAKLAMVRKPTFSAQILGLKQIEIAFFMWGIGILFAICIFIFEFLAKFI